MTISGINNQGSDSKRIQVYRWSENPLTSITFDDGVKSYDQIMAMINNASLSMANEDVISTGLSTAEDSGNELTAKVFGNA